MGAKQLTYSDEARQKLLAGVSKLARAVRSTLGRAAATPCSTRAGAARTSPRTASPSPRRSSCNDPYENMGAQLVKEAASKTSDVAGDGTTTATVLAEAIYREGLKMIAAGADPMALTRGIQKAVEQVVDELHKLAEKIDDKNNKEITEVATIAANNNPEIGKKLAEAMKKVGATTASSPSRKARPPKPKSSSSRACSSTAATCRRTSSPIRNRSSSSWKTRTSSSTKKRSPPPRT